MRVVSLRLLLLTCALLALPPLAPLRPGHAAAQDDAARFADLIAARDELQSLAGPLAGELVQQAGYSSLDPAGVSVVSFSATATFQNPDQPGDAPWDFGFVFGQTADGSQQVVLDSGGNWYNSPYPEGTTASGLAAALDSTPGAANTIDLIVDGEVAYLGVNGEFVTTLDLPAPIESDVLIGTGFFTSSTEPDRVIPYDDFTVWPLRAESAPATETPPAGAREIVEPPPASTPTVEQVPPGFSSEAEAFSYLLQTQANAIPLAGPLNANLKEDADRVALSWANVNLADFHVRATFVVPGSASGVPWDIGFSFRSTPSGQIRLIVDSLGAWRLFLGNTEAQAEGTVAGIVTTPGATNTIDLFVAADRAVFGVNGAYVAQVDLPSGATAADVAALAGFFNDQTVVDRVTAFQDFLVLPFDANAIAPPPDGTELSPADQQAFAGYVADTESIAPAVGPFAGRLVESELGTVPLASAGIALADFGAVASVTNPDDLSTALWDAGLQFWGEGAAVHRVVLRSNGEVHLMRPGQASALVGTASAYDASPGATNTLYLFVSGSRALIGVNEHLVAAVDLEAAPVASDIQLGAEFLQEDFLQGRVTGYANFSVWSMT